MTDIVAFIRERLAEDEAYARQILAARDEDGCGYLATWSSPASGVVRVGDGDLDELLTVGDSRLAYHIARWDPARVLAEVAAKRALLDEITAHFETTVLGLQMYLVPVITPGGIGYQMMRILAQPYASHADFDPAWRAS